MSQTVNATMAAATGAAPISTAASSGLHCFDNKFGPWAGPLCRGGFDFTLLFEETILVIPVQCLLLYVLPTRLMQLMKEDVKVHFSPLRLMKFISSSLYIGLSSALLSTWAKASGDELFHTRASIPTAAVSVAAAFAFWLLSWIEHERTIKPSFILNVYCFLSLILDLARTRTLYMLEPTEKSVAIMQTLLMVCRAVMLILESTEKRSILKSKDEKSPEVLSGPLNRAVFGWLMPLFGKGYRRNLVLEDLYPLDERLKARNLHKQISDAWEDIPNKRQPGIFCKVWFRCFRAAVWQPVIPRLFVIGFTYSQPFLIEKAVALAALPEKQPFNNYGYGLIGAFLFSYLGLAVSMGQYTWRVRRIGARMRGSLMAMVFDKSMRLDLTSTSVSPTGALTLVGNDTETIVQGLNQLHETWAGILEMGIAVFLIERQLGPACAIPIGVGLVVIICTAMIAFPTGVAQAQWIKASQDRVTATSKALGGIKWLKISGLSDMAFNMMRRLRRRELAISLRYRMLLGTTMVMLVLVPIWSPILTFATWAGVAKNGDGGGLPLTKVFTSYSLIVLLNGPLANMIIALPVLAGAMTSFQRVQNHLNGKERRDNRMDPRQVRPHDYLPELVLPNLDDKDFDETVELMDGSDSSESFELAELKKPGSMDKKSNFKADDNIIASIDGTFCWSGDAEPCLDIRDLNIWRETLTFIVGPVGCGKSTLLKGFLGELSNFNGAVETNYTGVVLCDQSPWIPNDTVRNIIIGPLQFDEFWYRKVVQACALEEDFQNWPNGDDTESGSGGMSMSGGQKQRLALARAVYSRREFILLDDVLSGLDATTENWVFHSLLGRRGLLRQGKMTVVSATSNVSRLRYADQVIFLDENGEIRDSGSPKKLEAEINQLAAAPNWDVEPNKEDELPMVEPLTKETAVLNAPETEEDPTRRLGDTAMYPFYARAAGRLTLLGVIASMSVYAFCAAFPTVWLGWWAGSKDPLDNLGKWLGVYIALGIGAVIAVSAGVYQILVIVIERSGQFFHDTMVDAIASAPLSFFMTTDTGVTVNRFSQDLRLIDMELSSAAFGVSTSLAFSLSQFIMVAVMSKYMAAMLPLLIFILWATQFFYLRTSRQLRLLDIENKSPLYSQLIELLSGLPTVRAFQWEDWLQEKNMELIDNAQRPAYLLNCLQCWLNFATDLFVAIVALIFVVLATTLREELGAQSIGVGLSNVLGFSNTVKTLVTFWVMLEIALGAVSRVRTFSRTTYPEGHDQPPTQEPPEGDEWPGSGYIEINNVVASYPTSGPILKGVTFNVRPGEKVAICGRTGSGKSSLTLCLLRLMALEEGSISIDGYDLSILPHEFVRQRLVALPQEPYIFDGTMRLNMDPEQTIDDEDIVEVLERVHLWHKIEARGGLDTQVNDDFFSPGEAQLVVFARAMLRKSRILILDEFTSNLDENTSEIVDKVMRTWFDGWTIITIAHKLDSVMDYDKVAVLDAGELQEFEPPQRLLARKDSAFRALYEAQSQQ